jgi:hypothetical protein
MKRISSLIVKSLVTLLIGGATLATSVQAQEDWAVTATVPFPFTVGKQSIAPGTYQFSLESSLFLLSVTNVKTGDKELFTVRPENQPAIEEHGRIIFRDSDGSNALNEVHFPGTDMFSKLIVRHGPRRMEAKKSSSSHAVSIGHR